MNKLLILGLILAFLLLPLPVLAAEEVNKFGIHILEPADLLKAKELVNANGGDWGFVTVVIRDDDRDAGKWQKFFDDCRRSHLVPMVRLATHLAGDAWVKPLPEDLHFWTDFLGSLNWPVKNKYIVVFNEPNHQKEWGGQINPQEYGRLLEKTISLFKETSPDFKIINAGLDLAAPNSKETMDALEFWRQIHQEVPDIFAKLDGWASHSYPNHGYLGTPGQAGRTSIRGYQWELAVLKDRFGLTKDLPVFITETGWPYQVNSKSEIRNPKFYNQEITAKYIKQAYENVWLPDKRVMAVTPFVLYYPQPPFANFSWITAENKESVQFLTVKDMPKMAWRPEQEFGLKMEKITLPPFLPTSTSFTGKLQIRNTGQSIWGERGMIGLAARTVDAGLEVAPLQIPGGVLIEPGKTTEIDFTLTSSSRSGELTFAWEHLPEFKIAVVRSGILAQVRYTLWQKLVFWLEQKLLF